MQTNGIAEINFLDKKVALRFGLPCVRYLVEKTKNLPLTNKEGTWYNELGVAHMIYGAYLNACLAEDSQPQIKFSQLYDYLETEYLKGEFPEDVVSAIRVFESSKAFEKGLEVSAEAKKKSLTGNESNSSPMEVSELNQENITA